ncbi:hypothetical protein B0H14DRAFT_3521992 [Mycena olivaceomarginata]|nr:hypothetical protein B0H14DRAFT_3521992 [Mycena olivaceomarginata]
MRTAPQQSDKVRNNSPVHPTGIPDVSAQARKFQIVWQGQRISIGGTSAVTPTFAGLVALLNDARLAAPRSGFSIPCCGSTGLRQVRDAWVQGDQGMGTSLHERSTTDTGASQ